MFEQGHAATADKKALPLRLPPKLWVEINRWARDELRSVNGPIEYLLRDAVKRRRRQDLEEELPPDITSKQHAVKLAWHRAGFGYLGHHRLFCQEWHEVRDFLRRAEHFLTNHPVSAQGGDDQIDEGTRA